MEHEVAASYERTMAYAVDLQEMANDVWEMIADGVRASEEADDTKAQRLFAEAACLLGLVANVSHRRARPVGEDL